MKTQIATLSKSIALLTVLGLMAAAAMAAPVHAADGEDTLTKKVSYADLDLDNAAGVAVLYSRLRAAARTVCTPFESKDLTQKAHWQKCYSQAVTTAVNAINKPALSAFHQRAMREGETG